MPHTEEKTFPLEPKKYCFTILPTVDGGNTSASPAEPTILNKRVSVSELESFIGFDMDHFLLNYPSADAMQKFIMFFHWQFLLIENEGGNVSHMEVPPNVFALHRIINRCEASYREREGALGVGLYRRYPLNEIIFFYYPMTITPTPPEYISGIITGYNGA